MSFSITDFYRFYLKLPLLVFVILFATTECIWSQQTATSSGTTPVVVPQSSPSPTPQASPSPTPSSLEKEFLKNLGRDQISIWTSPFHLQSKDAKWLVPFGLSTAALIATDRKTAGAVRNGKTQHDVSRVVSDFGSAYTTAGVVSSFYLIGRATHNQRARETGLLGAEALIDTGIVVTVLKKVTQRPRPLFDNGRGTFFHGGSSFPSGHSASIWSLATVISYEYHDKPLIKYGVYGVAAAVSVSRFTGRNHFLSDILVGGAIGYGIGRFVYRTHHVEINNSGDSTNPPATKVSKWIPFIAPIYEHQTRTYGGALAWSF